MARLYSFSVLTLTSFPDDLELPCPRLGEIGETSGDRRALLRCGSGVQNCMLLEHVLAQGEGGPINVGAMHLLQLITFQECHYDPYIFIQSTVSQISEYLLVIS